jgi:hypothetical protein
VYPSQARLKRKRTKKKQCVHEREKKESLSKIRRNQKAKTAES